MVSSWAGLLLIFWGGLIEFFLKDWVILSWLSFQFFIPRCKNVDLSKRSVDEEAGELFTEWKRGNETA